MSAKAVARPWQGRGELGGCLGRQILVIAKIE